MQRVSVASYNHKELPGWPFTTAKKGNKIVSKMREEHVSLFFFFNPYHTQKNKLPVAFPVCLSC